MYNYTLVNFSSLIHIGHLLGHEPFIFADPKEPEWSVVVHTKPRDLFDMRPYQVKLRAIIMGLCHLMYLR